MIDTVQSFSAMLRETLGDRLNPGAETFVEMFAEDGVMEFPYALPSPRRLEGREALAAHLAYLARLVELLSVSDVVKHETTDPEVFIVEFASSGRAVATGEPFEQRYISVIRVRDGHIVHYKDYWNPLAILRTMRGREFVESLAPR
jgi:ketosteroid isomerase-like protein